MYAFEGDDNTVLLHDDTLLPHWEEFANALQLYQNPEASHNFGIFKIQLNSKVIGLLAPALKVKPFHAFELDNVEYASVREGIDFAVEVIQSNPKLQQFYWGNNPIESMGGANRLVNAIISHPSIDKITLENCFGENVNAYDVLCSLLASSKQFSYIDLETNNIRTGGRTEIPDFLATNPPLETLLVEDNHLDDNDATLIARALKRNTNLRRLRLDENDITDVGREALGKAVFDSTSLNAVADSIHSCFIEGIDFDHINDDEESKVNRGRKIYRLLESRHREGTNARHLDAEFDDDSLRLVPKVLEAVHHNAGYGLGRVGHVHPLSLLYEILRSWKMPTLYENNGTA